MPDAAMKNGWHMRRFDEMAVIVNDRIDDPSEADVERYVGLEHLDSDSLTIRRWGSPDDVEATKLRFRTGDIIFGRRRAYQRKLAVADFDGICSAHAMVLRARPEVVLPAFLPFLMQSDVFMERATEISVGSLSPTINWKTLAKEQFALPPIEEQRRIANLLNASYALTEQLIHAGCAAKVLYDSAGAEQLARPGDFGVSPADWKVPDWTCEPLENLVLPSAPICYGIVQVGDPDPIGVPTLVIKDLKGDFSSGVHRTSSSIEARYTRSRIKQGDLLISIKATIGEVAIVPDGFKGNISRDLARLRFDTTRLRPRFFLHLYRSPRYTQYVKSLLVGSTRAELSIAALRNMLVPHPLLVEQDRLIEEMDAIERAQAVLARRATHAFSLNRQVLEAVLSQTGERR